MASVTLNTSPGATQCRRVNDLNLPSPIRNPGLCRPLRLWQDHQLTHAADWRTSPLATSTSAIGWSTMCRPRSRHRHGLSIVCVVSHLMWQEYVVRAELRKTRTRKSTSGATDRAGTGHRAAAQPQAGAALRRAAPARAVGRAIVREPQVFLSTSRCPTSTRNCACRPARRSSSCTSSSAQLSCT